MQLGYKDRDVMVPLVDKPCNVNVSLNNNNNNSSPELSRGNSPQYTDKLLNISLKQMFTYFK